MGKYIYFKKVEVPKRKTELWQVISSQHQICLGHISWNGAWRCYSFYPAQETVYEQQCLRDLADFCERLTKQWRETQKEKKK